MQEEIIILKVCMQKKYYYDYHSILRKLSTLERVHKYILSILEYIYTNTDITTVSYEELVLQARLRHPSHSKEIEEIIQEMAHVEVSPETTAEILNNLVEKHFIGEIITTGIPVVEGTEFGKMDDIQELIHKYRDLLITNTQEEVDLSKVNVTEIIEKRNKGKFAWPLQGMQQNCEALPLGHLIHAFAYKETGKTAFGVTHACHFAKQIRSSNRNICYLCNEENYEITYLRTVSCFKGVPLYILKQNPEMAHEAYQYYVENGGLRIRFVNAVHHVHKIKEVMEKYEPMIVFIDQGPKVAPYGAKNLSSVETKQRIFQTYRELANKHRCSFFSLGQADQTAEGKKWIRLNQMDGSKVGIPGELDLAIGIGKESDSNARRHINIVANKLTGKLGRFTCGFDYDRSLYYD